MSIVEGPKHVGILSRVKVDSVDKEGSLDSVSVQKVRDGTNGQRAVVDSNGNCLGAHTRRD